MDDFGFDQPELTGTLISMEFGTGGRIQKLWVTNPESTRDSEEFQFVAPPVPIGEELSEDYFPGTILIGARSHPEAPWILGRNTLATVLDEDEDGVAFQYDIGDIEELEVIGRFRENRDSVPFINWDITVKNRGRRIVEIGELAFPMAMADFADGWPATDDGRRRAWRDRLHVHQAIAGAASYLHARRASGKSPALTIFPGKDTNWEFTNRVRASLASGFRWGGIPIVYVHSRAALEREEWIPWLGEPSTAILEPGETREYQIGFAPADGGTPDGLAQSLFACKQPIIRIFPSAVIPYDVGTTIEVAGVTPARVWTATDSPLNTDADPEGGSCYVKGRKAGPEVVFIEDVDGRISQSHILFTPPIRKLIEARAKYIVAHQIVKSGPLKDAILPGDNRTMEPFMEPATRMMPTTLVYGLADALYLADKNTLYPNKAEIAALDRYVENFFERKVFNPGDGSIGCLLPEDTGVAVDTGRVKAYPLAAGLYQAMARITEIYPGLTHEASHYQERASLAAQAAFRKSTEESSKDVGIPESRLLTESKESLAKSTKYEQADIKSQVTIVNVHGGSPTRTQALRDLRYPYGGPGNWSNDGFDEVIQIKRKSDPHRALGHLFAGRMTSPNWWWNGSDKRWFDEPMLNPDLVIGDRGETCLAGSTATNGITFLEMLDRDPITHEDERIRAAYGGFLGIWGLVREDGAGAAAFCPDTASAQFGFNWCTGDIGASLSRYIRSSATWILPVRGSGLQSFGGTLKYETRRKIPRVVVRPWDGVGRRIFVRQLGVDVVTTFGHMDELSVDLAKRTAHIKLTNPSDRDQICEVNVKGLWGTSIRSDDVTIENSAQGVTRSITLTAKSTRIIPFETL